MADPNYPDYYDVRRRAGACIRLLCAHGTWGTPADGRRPRFPLTFPPPCLYPPLLGHDGRSKRVRHQVLGLTRGANDAEIKRNYRKLAMKWHPDKNQNSAEAATMFQSIGEAYDVLSDKEKKAIYDQCVKRPPSTHARTRTSGKQMNRNTCAPAARTRRDAPHELN